MSDILANLARIRSEISNTTLIAVSKTCSADSVTTTINAGQRIFGENRVQEAQEKFAALRQHHPDLVLHLIGALQTNKAQAAVDCFDVIQTIDRESLADALAKAIEKTGRKPRLYIQINIGDEPQKSGIAVDAAEDFLSYCRDKCGLEISGLMCIPPQGQPPQPYFKKMREMADRFHLPHLSMGMSEDYKSAIECGATEVRIGSAIFGARG